MHLLYTASSRLLLLAALAVSLTLAGCDIFDDPERPTQDISTESVLVSSQGNFGDATAGVTEFNVELQQASTPPDLELTPLIQSIDVLNDRLFVLRRDQISVHSIPQYKKVGLIPGIENAQYILFGKQDIALVTSFLPPKLNMVDTIDYDLLATVDLEGFLGNMAVDRSEQLIFVAQGRFGSSEEIAVVRPNIDEQEFGVEKSINAECAVTFLFTLSPNEISGLCNTSDGNGQYIVIDVNEKEVVIRKDIGGRISTNPPGQDGFFARDIPAVFAVLDDERIVQLNPITGEIDAEIGPLAGNPIGGVSFDEVDNLLYVARPAEGELQFQATGEVSIHELDGTEVGRFDAGIAPSHIVFSRVIE